MPPAPPTDPDAIWPPTPTPSTPKLPTYIPGFAYDARNIRWEARRLRFSIAQNQPWQSWCQLQTSYQVGPDSYSCIPGNGGVGTDHGCFAQDDNGNIISEVPCFKLAGLCGVTGPCACDAAGCQSENLRGFTFDIALRDGVADGSTDLAGNINVRLTQTGH